MNNMQTEKVMEQILPIFREELEDESIVLTPSSTAAEIENWDSLTNIQLIVSIEKYYKIRFTSKEIQEFKNVGELCACILSKLSRG